MDLKITIIQSDLYWENVDQNLGMFADKIQSINEHTDIIVLPEMFNTGFSMNSEKLSETMQGKTVAWMKEIAKRSNAVIVGSLIIKDVILSGVERYYNRLLWVQPDGDFYTYDKRHLFRMANEHEHFSAGHHRIIVNYKGWRICPLICYDLRFPVWSRNMPIPNPSRREGSMSPGVVVEGSSYDILIYIANWPAPRKKHWSKLLEARAIENQCYVVGVNRIGEDGNNFSYTGNSAIINHMGENIAPTSENTPTIKTIELSLSELNAWREKFPVSLDGDEFSIIP